MSEAVAKYFGNHSTRELKVGDCILDVVAYDDNEDIFKVVECKLGSKPTSIGHAFGQVAAYDAILTARGRAFIKAFADKVHLGFQLMDATKNGRQLDVAFYVALTKVACGKEVELIRSLKKLLPSVGIIRVRPDSTCSSFLWRKGKKDYKLANASPTKIDILQT